jgi:UDP-N-acetyl-D-mannosaminuronate dehydrogenase
LNSKSTKLRFTDAARNSSYPQGFASDLILIATNHSTINYDELGNWAQRIVDTRNAMAGVSNRRAKVWKA